ncbi:MAG: Rieske family ferredoxin [Pseudomonadota bacterium]
MIEWIDGFAVQDIEEEDVIRFDGPNCACAVFRTDGLRSHEQIHLAEGLVSDNTLECPEQNERFHYKPHAASNTPARDLPSTYTPRVVNGRIKNHL